MSDDDYLKALLASYEDEVIGEAYFGSLGDHFSVKAQREKLALLGEVERRTAGLIRPLIDRHGLAPRTHSVLSEAGRIEARAYRGVSWPDLMQEMAGTYQVFVEEFRALEHMAPDDDRPALSRLTEHEQLIIAFAEQELAGSRDSLDAIRRFLEDDLPPEDGSSSQAS